VSSIWTPGGEHPVDPEPAGRPAPPPNEDPARELSDADLTALRDQLAHTPAAAVVANHCLGLFELAALHISLQPPQLDQAALAIDGLGAIVERLEGRLGEDEPTLRDALAQIRLAFVQVGAAAPDHSDA
jgi:hypothetical protein